MMNARLHCLKWIPWAVCVGIAYPIWVCVCVCVLVCVCVSVSVTTLAGTMRPLKAKVRYQLKALNVGNEINVGIELKVLSS